MSQFLGDYRRSHAGSGGTGTRTCTRCRSPLCPPPPQPGTFTELCYTAVNPHIVSKTSLRCFTLQTGSLQEETAYRNRAFTMTVDSALSKFHVECECQRGRTASPASISRSSSGSSTCSPDPRRAFPGDAGPREPAAAPPDAAAPPLTRLAAYSRNKAAQQNWSK